MTNEEFEQLVKQGIDSIPQKFLDKLKNVEICIEDNPTQEELNKAGVKANGLLFGLYQGVPLIKRESYGMVLPDKITIFKNPIEEVNHSPEEIKKAVANTVWHEIAHHFGMDEREVRQAEQKRKK